MNEKEKEKKLENMKADGKKFGGNIAFLSTYIKKVRI
jgi:hypothetical protein